VRIHRSLTFWILVAIVAGAVLGHYFPDLAVSLRFVGQIFLRLIRTIVAPLLFATLVVGIAGHSNLRQVGRMGVKALVYFEVVTTLALLIGWAAISISRAGEGITLPASIDASQLPAAASRTWQDVLLHIFPENIAKAVVDGEILQVVVFSVIFGSALALLPEEKKRPMLAFAGSLAETMFKFTGIVMVFAPFGVGARSAYTVGHLGVGVLVNLAKLLATFYVAVAVFVASCCCRSRGWCACRCALRARGGRAGVDRVCHHQLRSGAAARDGGDGAAGRARRSGLRDADGYSFNLDGSTLYLSLTAIFVAQAPRRSVDRPAARAAVHADADQQGRGWRTARRARHLMGTVASFGLPAEPVFMILGIDALLDMMRTSVNVLATCLATVVIAMGRRIRRGKWGPALAGPWAARRPAPTAPPTNPYEYPFRRTTPDRRRSRPSGRAAKQSANRARAEPAVQDFDLVRRHERRMRHAAGAAERQQLLPQRHDLVGHAHRLQRRVEPAREPRALGGDAGGAVVGVALERLNAPDREQRLAGHVDQVAAEREAHERRVGQSQPARSDEHDVLVQPALREHPLHAAEAHLERQADAIGKHERRGAGAPLAAVQRHEVHRAAGRIDERREVTPEAHLAHRGLDAHGSPVAAATVSTKSSSESAS
jgi:proton glutamate symport protein